MDRPVSLIFHLQNNKKKKLPEVKSEIMCLQKKKNETSHHRGLFPLWCRTVHCDSSTNKTHRQKRKWKKNPKNIKIKNKCVRDINVISLKKFLKISHVTQVSLCHCCLKQGSPTPGLGTRGRSVGHGHVGPLV